MGVPGGYTSKSVEKVHSAILRDERVNLKPPALWGRVRGRTNGRRVEARENSYILNIACRARSTVSIIRLYDALVSCRPGLH